MLKQRSLLSSTLEGYGLRIPDTGLLIDEERINKLEGGHGPYIDVVSALYIHSWVITYRQRDPGAESMPSRLSCITLRSHRNLEKVSAEDMGAPSLNKRSICLLGSELLRPP